MKTSNSRARFLVEERKPFTGSNCFAEINKNGQYIVYSYGYHYPLFVYNNGTWWVNKDRYSLSTTKHRNKLAPTAHLIDSNTQELNQLILCPNT